MGGVVSRQEEKKKEEKKWGDRHYCVWELGEEKWRKKWASTFMGVRRCGVGRIENEEGKK